MYSPKNPGPSRQDTYYMHEGGYKTDTAKHNLPETIHFHGRNIKTLMLRLLANR